MRGIPMGAREIAERLLDELQLASLPPLTLLAAFA